MSKAIGTLALRSADPSELLGYRLMKSQRQELVVLGMPLLVREVPFDEPASTQGLALAATTYSLFLNEYPKTNLDVTNQLRFGLSEPGRFQLYLNASVRRELWHDFFIAGSVYDSYDNRPPASSTLKNDVASASRSGGRFDARFTGARSGRLRRRHKRDDCDTVRDTRSDWVRELVRLAPKGRFQRGRKYTCPSHSPSKLHSARRTKSSIACPTGATDLTSKTPGIG